MACMIVSCVTNQLKDLLKEQAKNKIMLVVGIDDEIIKIGMIFDYLVDFLIDAEVRQMSEESVGRWLQDYKNVAYRMEDVLDEWRTEMLRVKMDQRRCQREDDGNQAEGANPNYHEVLSYLCSVFSCLETSWVSCTLFSYFNRIKTIPLRNNIGSRIKGILNRLDSVNRAKNEFRFYQNCDPIPEDFYINKRKETSSIIIDRPNIFGRDSDKKIILNKLLGVESSTNHWENETRDPRIISIVGMGGLGKSTLAQLVFEHAKEMSHFNLLMWVCVSHPFDRLKVAKAIIREATGKGEHTSTWNPLFGELCESVMGKRFLLVLDDVWTSDPTDLKDLTYLLDLGEQGSRILVTTRKEAVVSALNSYGHILPGLNSHDSSLLLQRKAFHGKEKKKSEILEDIATKISNKCLGLPLALSLLGSLLNKRISEIHWRGVLESKIWELKGFDVQKKLVYPIFLISYDGIWPLLKTLFQYCAIFPKAHKIRKRTLFRLWMAQGYLNSGSGKDPELIAEECFHQLADRAFFQDFSIVGTEVSCKMHDLVHDFAQFLTKDSCYESYNNEDTFCLNLNSNPIHLSLIYDERDMRPISFNDSIKKVDNVRTIWCNITRSRIQMDHSFGVGNFSSDLIPHLGYLRVLKLKGMGITDITNEIDKLIHLRYLDLSRNYELNELPDSMCGLINLQTLKLKMCLKVIRLPKEMRRMINLRNLDIRSASGLVYLPEGIRNWKSLHILSDFVASAATEV